MPLVAIALNDIDVRNVCKQQRNMLFHLKFYAIKICTKVWFYRYLSATLSLLTYHANYKV